MKRIIIMTFLIYYCFCSIEECIRCKNQEQCNSIDVEESELYCFKADFYQSEERDYDPNNKCVVYLKKEENQKIYKRIINGFIKESFSFYGKELDQIGEEAYEHIGASLEQTEKESYKANEIIKFVPGKLSSTDKNILKSEKTCSYYLYGKFYSNNYANYEDISDKNTCFNAQKFDEFKNIIDCGYAIIKFKVNGNDYEIKTCYLIPTANLPELFNEQFLNNIENDAIDDDGMLSDIFGYISGTKILNNDCSRRRRLSTITYSIEVENKYGRKIKFSSDNNNMEIISEGTPGPNEEDEESSEGNNGAYMDIKILKFILIFLFFVL